MEKTSKLLFKYCMKGEWEKVIETYKKEKKSHTMKITRAGDTALHVAVTDGLDDVVERLVLLIYSEDQRKEGLLIQNERKNTALHFAASMGSERMCECIASAEKSLLNVRNVNGETPLFLAALHGRKKAFLLLHYLCNAHPNDPNYYSNCRRNDGETILHAAIAGDYFDLAFQIIHLYKDMVNWVNEDGYTPLHVLANKPSVFRSGGRLGRFEAIVYCVIIVKELKVAPHDQQTYSRPKGEKMPCPENYRTCMELWRLTKIFTQVGSENWLRPSFPANYESCMDIFEFVLKIILIIFGIGPVEIRRIIRKKEKHMWSAQILDELLERASMYEFDDTGAIPLPMLEDGDEETPFGFDHKGRVSFRDISDDKLPLINTNGKYMQKKDEKNKKKMETPILIAAKNGVTEMVAKIMELFPVAVHDMDAKNKNIVLLAVENRQTYLFNFLINKKNIKESIRKQVDSDGNSALHLAAKFGDYKPWLIPDEVQQMLWEIKWYLFVEESMGEPSFFRLYNNENKTPRDIFSETHKVLTRRGGEWLKKTSESCSLVAALIATVAFSTSTTIPGDFTNGAPTLQNRAEFSLFAISSLIALCCSVTSLVLFLSMQTCRYQERDFGKSLPRKLIIGLTSLFMSITSMMVCFCAGNFVELKENLRSAAFPVYAVTCLTVTLFALSQFPLYFNLIWDTFNKVPQRGYETSLH